METLTMGVDVGSTTSKCVVLKDGKEFLSHVVVPVGAGTSGPKRAIDGALEQAGKTLGDMQRVFVTGYGRHSLEEADKELSELTCHAKGAWFFFPEVRTIIDIGGQDAKAMQIAEGGRMLNFVMNDKCAAGTGRFLDVMARVLEVEVKDFSKLAAQSAKEVTISSTCTVFAESEVISQLAQKAQIPDIIAGICRSVAVRTAGLAKRIDVKPMIVMTGGVALCTAIVQEMEKKLGYPIATSPYAQLMGAMGAAIYAWEDTQKQV